MQYTIDDYTLTSSTYTSQYTLPFIPDIVYIHAATAITLSGDITFNTDAIPGVGSVMTYYIMVDGGVDLNTHAFSINDYDVPQITLDTAYFIATFISDGSAWGIPFITYPNGVGGTIDGSTIIDGSVPFTALEALTSAKILVGNASNVAAQVSVSGDITIDNAGVTTIGANKVTNAKAAQMATLTVKANTTGSTANAQDVAISTLVALSGWSKSGNAGTTPGTDFIGTTDSQDLVFKTDNIESGRIDISSGNTSFGQNSSLAITTGLINVAFGTNALKRCTSGQANSAIGSDALNQLTTGSGNTANGESSGASLTGGGYNTLIGQAAGTLLSTGSYNTCIGTLTVVDSATSSHRIALGYGALADTDYQFALPDDVTSVKWKGLVYVLPTSQAAGVLTNDGSGNLSWA